MLKERLLAEQRIVVSDKQVIVLVIVVSVKCEQRHKSSENNKEFN